RERGGKNDGQQRRQRRDLPQEMNQRPTQIANHIGREEGGKRGHLFFLSCSSRRRRISSISSGGVRLPARACMTSCVAEPLKARSMRSLTSWLLVWLGGWPAS